MTERIYIAGPMTGLPDLNYPAFAQMAAHLRSLGCEVISPAELFTHSDRPWAFYMRACLQAMLTCNSIVMLKGWPNSKGASIEFNLAEALGMQQYYEGSDFL